MIKTKNHTLYGWVMSQNFEWIKDTAQLKENCIKNYNQESDTF